MKGVLSGFKLNPDRCTLQRHHPPKSVLQVPPIGGGDALGLVTMNYNGRRVRPTHMGVTELDAPSPDQGGLVLLQGVFQHLGQNIGGQCLAR